MKRLLQLTAITVVLVSIGGTILILKLNTVVAAMKPQIEEAATAAMGTPVQFRTVSVRLLPTAHLVATGIAIGSEASSAISVETLEVEVPLLPLFRGALEITSLSVSSPSITIIKSKGKAEIQGLPKAPPLPETSSASETHHKGKPLPITLNLKSFRVSNGAVRVIDAASHHEDRISGITIHGGISIVGNDISIPTATLTATADGVPPLSVEVTNLSLAMNSLTTSIERAVASGAGVNITLAGKAVNVGSMQGDLVIAGTGIDLREATRSLPSLQQYKLGGHIVPDINYRLSRTNPFHAQGTCRLSDISATLPSGVLEQLKATLQISPRSTPSDGSTLTTDDLTLNLNGEAATGSIHGEISYAPTSARISGAKIAMAGGSVELSGSISDKKAFSSAVAASNLSIPRLVKAVGVTLPIGVEGTISKVTSTIQGSLGPALPTSLEGPATLELRDSSLIGINLVRVVLAKVDSIPFIEGALIQHVPENFRGLLESRDTPIRHFEAALSLKQGLATISKLRLESSLFSLEGSGTYGITDGTIDINTAIRFTEAFSTALADKSNGLKNLLDSQGQLTFPLAIKGTPPNVLVLPDIAKLMELRAGKVIEKKALGLLSKVLGGDKHNNDSQETANSDKPRGLEKGLKRLLGGL